jgi:serine/threonine protein kinase
MERPGDACEHGLVPTELARYEFVRRIGGGGMGDVYLAHKKGIGGFSKPVAVKLMRPDLAATPRAVDLFLLSPVSRISWSERRRTSSAPSRSPSRLIMVSPISRVARRRSTS